MDLVDEVDLSVAFSKLVLGVNEDESALGGDLLTACEELACLVLNDGIVLCRHDALLDDLLA